MAPPSIRPKMGRLPNEMKSGHKTGSFGNFLFCRCDRRALGRHMLLPDSALRGCCEGSGEFYPSPFITSRARGDFWKNSITTSEEVKAPDLKIWATQPFTLRAAWHIRLCSRTSNSSSIQTARCTHLPYRPRRNLRHSNMLSAGPRSGPGWCRLRWRAYPS